jgi:hypothetical protein
MRRACVSRPSFSWRAALGVLSLRVTAGERIAVVAEPPNTVAEFEAGHLEDSRALFTRAHSTQPNARTLRGLGIAEFELRKYVESARAPILTGTGFAANAPGAARVIAGRVWASQESQLRAPGGRAVQLTMLASGCF